MQTLPPIEITYVRRFSTMFKGKNKWDTFKPMYDDLVKNVFAIWSPEKVKHGPDVENPPTFHLDLLTPYQIHKEQTSWRSEQEMNTSAIQAQHPRTKPMIIYIYIYIIPRLDTEEWVDVPQKETLKKPYVVIDIKDEGDTVQFVADGERSQKAVIEIRDYINEKILRPQSSPALPSVVGAKGQKKEVWWKNKVVVGIGIVIMLAIIVGIVLMAVIIPRAHRHRR